MKKRLLFSALVLVLALGFVLTSCSDSLNPLTRVSAPTPTGVSVSKISGANVLVITCDNLPNVTGYNVYLRQDKKEFAQNIGSIGGLVPTLNSNNCGYESDGTTPKTTGFDSTKIYISVPNALPVADVDFNIGIQAMGVADVASNESAPSDIYWVSGNQKL